MHPFPSGEAAPSRHAPGRARRVVFTAEPAAALAAGEVTSPEVRELAGAGMTMVIATHEMGFARDIASRVCFLEDGHIVEEAPPGELFSAPKDERTKRFLRRIISAGRL